jgi:hypothetical protein
MFIAILKTEPKRKAKKAVNRRKRTLEQFDTGKSTYLNVLIPCRSKSMEVCNNRAAVAKSTVKSVKQPQQNSHQPSLQFNTQNHYKLNWSDIPFVVGQVFIIYLND